MHSVYTPQLYKVMKRVYGKVLRDRQAADSAQLQTRGDDLLNLSKASHYWVTPSEAKLHKSSERDGMEQIPQSTEARKDWKQKNSQWLRQHSHNR